MPDHLPTTANPNPDETARVCDGAMILRSGWWFYPRFVASTRRPPMRPSEPLDAHRQEIREIVAAHRAPNARVFGSVARGADTEGSDLDILIDPSQGTSLFDLGAIRYRLRALLKVEVDVLTPNSLPERFRAAEARPI